MEITLFVRLLGNPTGLQDMAHIFFAELPFTSHRLIYFKVSMTTIYVIYLGNILKVLINCAIENKI